MDDRLDNKSIFLLGDQMKTNLDCIKSFLLFAFVLFVLVACSPMPTPSTAFVGVTAPATLAVPTFTTTPTSTVTPVLPTRTVTPTPLPPLVKGWGARQEVLLDGRWEYIKVKSLDDALPTSGWQSFNVPGLLNGYNYERAWFRRKFNAPEQWRGQRLIIEFGGVKYNSRVLVNGKNVGGTFNGYDAFELDITDAVKLGAENELLVGVYDWTGIFVGAPMSFPSGMDMNVMRQTVRDRLIAPFGGQYWMYGIWDSVNLRIVAPTYIQTLFVRPLVQKNRLEVDATIVNAGQQPFVGSLQARIFKWGGTGRDEARQWELRGNPIATFASTQVNLAAGKSLTTTLLLEKPPLELWSPYSPQLYVIEVGFDSGDAVRERIGWRELDTRGGDFYFNGKKIHLLATSYWPPSQPVTREYVVGELKAIRAMNAVAFRTHTQPWSRMWYEVADEIGVMMIPEGAIWNDDIAYRVDDPKFWENYATHLRAMVRHLHNHPSVVMWSLENELYGTRINDNTPNEAQLANLGKIVQQEDPTRPITYESDGDPGGVADVIGMHYPNEYPERRLWPQDAYWMETPRSIFGGGGLFWDNQPFLWDHKKPLYIGEYLWIPSRDPSTQTLFFGDEAYRSHKDYRSRGKAIAWRMQILAYRHYGVSGQSPWTVHEEGPMNERNPTWVTHRDMYRPLAAFVREQDTRFYSGDVVTRTVELFNDTMGDVSLAQFRWALLDGEKSVASGSENLAMPSGDHQERVIQIAMPQVSERKQFKLHLTMHVGNEEKFREDYPVEVFPRAERWQLPNAPIVLYDPKGTLGKFWKTVPFRSLKQLQDWDGQGLLVVAPDALTRSSGASQVTEIGGTLGQSQWLAQQVQKGARVLVLEQTESASDWLPVQIGNQSSTLAFPQIATHPILRGITADDLRWWRGDHLVSHHEPIRAGLAGVRPLIVTGSVRGVANAPLVEIQQGNGVWLICQLQVVSKLESEPIARVLFERMLQYLDDFRPVAGTTLFLVTPSLQDQLSRIGVDAQPLTNWSAVQFPRVQLVVLQTDAATILKNADRLSEFIHAGGQVLWHRPDPKDFAQVRDVFKLPVTMQPYQGFALRAEGAGALFETILREDLYWLGKPGSVSWQETTLATDVTEYAFIPDEQVPPGETFEAERNVDLTGSIVQVQRNEVVFATNGSARWMIQIPQAGLYQFGLIARGTPAQGVYPIAQVLLDSQPLGILYIAKRESAYYGIKFRADAGAHQITVIYNNDLQAPPEDRNLYVDRYMISPGQDATGNQPLTIPGALVSVSQGKGQFVLDAIRWEDAGRNQSRAQRFIASLMTVLGARFQGRAQVNVVEAETMNPQPNLRYYRREADHIAMPSSGYVETQIRVVTGGRYRIGVVAKGDPADGVYPIVALELNGREIGRVECKSDDWTIHYITTDLPEGTSNLRLRFTNDLWLQDKGEDRNLWVDRIEFELLK
jgi:hypothetical protein